MVVKIKSASTMYKVGFATCLSYNKADMSTAADIILTIIKIREGKVILIRLY